MTTTISVSEEAKAQIEGDKVAGQSWSDYLIELHRNAELGEKPESADDVDLTPVLNRIDDLESQLPAKIKEELR